MCVSGEHERYSLALRLTGNFFPPSFLFWIEPCAVCGGGYMGEVVGRYECLCVYVWGGGGGLHEL